MADPSTVGSVSYERDHVLRDGTTVHPRPMRDDVPLLQDLWEDLTAP